MKINIIGAGISGLALGYFLKKNGHDVHIYEASSKAGGVIATEFVPEGMVQHGPHLMRMTHTLKVLLQELNINIAPALNTKRYIARLRDDLQFGFPLSLSDTLKAILLQFRKRKFSYTSLADFTNHHYGKSFTRNILQPIINGIYAVPAENLHHQIALKGVYFEEKRAIYRTLKVLLQKLHFKSVEIASPQNGFQDLINSLSCHLQNHIIYNTTIADISTLDGFTYITIPAVEAKNLRGISLATHKMLATITYSKLDVTTVFTTAPFEKEGIGFLTNAQSGILGMLFNSSAFRKRSITGLHSYSIFSKNLTENEIQLFCIKTLKVQLQKLYFKSYQQAVPIYNHAIKSFIERNATLNGKYKFFSNYTGEVAVGKIIDEAKKLAENLR